MIYYLDKLVTVYYKLLFTMNNNTLLKYTQKLLYISIIINIFFYYTNTTIFILFLCIIIVLMKILDLIFITKFVLPANYDWELDDEFSVENTLNSNDENSQIRETLPSIKLLNTTNKIVLDTETTIKDYVTKIISVFQDKNINLEYVKHNKGAMISQILFTNWYKFNKNNFKTAAKLSDIVKLMPDLRSNLGINEITIDTVIPGENNVIGINIPNTKRKLNKMGLYGLLSTQEYENFVLELTHKNFINGLPFTIGYTSNNHQLIYDLIQLPHLLIGGMTNSGKSVLLNTIITCIILKQTPNNVQFVMVDPKLVELTLYEKLAHLLKPVITDTLKVNTMLLDLWDEHTKRLKIIKDVGCKNLFEYNNKTKNKKTLPYIVVVLDEIAEILLVPDVEVNLLRLLQATRATGIHFILCTQRPSAKIVSPNLKAQTRRIALKMESLHDSKTILDVGGAEDLNGQGDGLVKIDGNLVRFQAPFVSTEEITKIVTEWSKLWNL